MATQERALAYQREHDTDIQSRRRRAIAQAMLIELGHLESAISNINPDNPGYFSGLGLSHRILDRGLETAQVFENLATVHRLAEVLTAIDNFGRSAVRLYDELTAHPISGKPLEGHPRPSAVVSAQNDFQEIRSRTQLEIAALDNELLNESRESPERHPEPRTLVIRAVAGPSTARGVGAVTPLHANEDAKGD